STKQQKGVWIFLLDGFGEADLQPPVKELAGFLVVRCTAPEYRRKTRVILVNYAEPCADLPPAAVLNEDVPLPSVIRRDVIDCLTQLNVLRRQKGLGPIEGLDTIADAMLVSEPEETDPRKKEKARLRHLYNQLRRVATSNLISPA